MRSIQPSERNPLYPVLDEFLVSRGWETDQGTAEPCWIYPLAFAGQDPSLDPSALDCAELAEWGPSRPTIYLNKREVSVITHGTWNGCAAHREGLHTFRAGQFGAALRCAALIADVEHASVGAAPEAFRSCLLSGPCGDRFRAWRYGEDGAQSAQGPRCPESD